MSQDQNAQDPLDFVRGMWNSMGFSLPGMVAPTFDLDELDKRIKDLKAVEGWLRMNLSMLQMTIQSLEMQRTTVSTVQAMGQMASDAARSMQAGAAEETPPPEAATAGNAAFSEAAMWPWQMMQQVREQMQQTAEAAVQAATAATTPATDDASDKKPRSRKPAAKT